MSARRGRLDAAVVGGGVVGAACALALADLGLEVALIEAQAPPPWQAERPDLRVYAFAPDNAALLRRLSVWPQVVAARAQPYRRMRVWDAAGGSELAFDADAFGRAELGWIVEHGLLVDKLWAALSAAGVRVSCPAKVEALEQLDDGVRLRLDDGTRVEANLAIAADGAESSVRALAGLEVDTHGYAQRGVVAYVRTERPHESTAWQRFLPTGPLAFLPCADGSSSIVWTLPEAEAARIVALDDDSFGAELTSAFGARLGKTVPLGKRVAFPLRRQLARDYAVGRIAVIGDAAHVVHPLAGQGVNLGLRDVSALCEVFAKAKTRRADFLSPQRLTRWARERKSENAAAAYAFDGINRVFSNDGVAATLLRGPLLGIADRVPMVSHGLWRRAAGLSA
ncbi:MAG TPA: UbiH/UbiF family hydroxylase [Luteimonas sp.]|nr:UbiH/UbiF family hydroxylase [Luteimonas sp.]